MLVFDLPETVRQREGTLMHQIVKSASKSTKFSQATSIEHLGKNIITRKRKSSRIAIAVKQYMSHIEKNDTDIMILADLNVDRSALTTTLRTRLREAGIIDKKEYEVKTLVNRDLTNAQKMESRYYNIGDIVIFHQTPQKLDKSSSFRITKIDKKTNRLELTSQNKSTFVSTSQLEKAQIFQTSSIDISVGDTLRWTKNHKGRINKHIVKVTNISQNEIELIDQKTKKAVSVNPNAALHLDYGLVMTVYSSQGHESKHGIFLAESNVSMNTWYTALTRMKESVVVITDSKEKLLDRISKSSEKINALELMDEKSGWIELKQKFSELERDPTKDLNRESAELER